MGLIINYYIHKISKQSVNYYRCDGCMPGLLDNCSEVVDVEYYWQAGYGNGSFV